jgi:two-component system OmpR family sensor kinase
MRRSLIKLYLYVLIGVAISTFMVNYAFMHVFYDRLQKQAIDSLAGYTFLLREYLEQRSKADQVNALAKLQGKSQDKFELIREIDFKELNAKALSDPRAGKVILSPKDYYLLLNNGLIIHVQPREPVNIGPQLLAFGVIALLLLLPVLLWLYFHWRELHILESAAREFGAGRLAVRIRVSKKSNVFELAQQFNDMADQIEMMILHQRDMMRGISHELKTPLARLKFGLALMQSTDSASEQQMRRDALQKDIGELDELISELLTLSRLEQGGVPLEILNVSIPELFDSIAASVANELSDQKLNLAVFSDSSLNCVCDPKLVARALLNLIRNSMRYATCCINLQARALTADTIELLVQDDGPGIPIQDRSSIFEPFYRRDNGSRPHVGGFGLGLAIVRSVVQVHRGQVRLEDTFESGARFIITLPRHHYSKEVITEPNG